MLREIEALHVRDEKGCKVVATWNRERNQSGWDGDGKDEVFLRVSMLEIGGRRALRRHLAKRYETREQMMGAGPTDASEIVS